MDDLIGLVILLTLALAFIPWARECSEPALEVLRRRYAAGELSKGEFEAMRRDLQDDAQR